MSDNRHHLIGEHRTERKWRVLDSTGGEDAADFLKSMRPYHAVNYENIRVISDVDLIKEFGQNHEIVSSSRLSHVIPRRMYGTKSRSTRSRRSPKGKAARA